MDKQTSKFDAAKMLKVVRTTLLALTGVLIWREVAADAVYLLLGATGLTFGAGLWLEKKQKYHVGPILSFVMLLLSAGWYAATREPATLAAMATTFVSFAISSWLHRERSTNTHRELSMLGAALSGLGLSLAVDFHLFHASELGDENFVARRVVLTIGWLIPGLWALVRGNKREDRAVIATGVVLTVAALGKLIFYDTVALDGVLRIASYGLAGLLTMVAGQLLVRKAPRAEVAS